MAAGLAVGLGEHGTDTVFRRSFSALVLAECIDARQRTRRRWLPDDKLLSWGDRLAAWLVRERDLRGFVPGKGWAHALAHGADALGALAESPRLGRLRAHRAARRDRRPAARADPDPARARRGRPARGGHDGVLRRDLRRLEVLEPWVARLADLSAPDRRRRSTTRSW